MRLTRAVTNPPWTVDVVVVGAGFAGLAAARELTRQGHEVLVSKAAIGWAAAR